MSHTVAIKTQLNNQNILEKTLNQLGWTIKQNCKIRTYPSDPQRDFVYPQIAYNPNRGYDVGITTDAEGNVSLHYDSFDGSVERTLGQQFAKLKTDYVINMTKEYYEEVQILEMLEDGSLILEADDGL